ncbi:MAG TPA: hypothetical protein VN682_17080 [Terriglobales bacterium]|nr:hypothetical protein [Terriglobales bacterium]
MKKLLGFALLFFLSAIPAFGQSKAGSVTAASTDCSVSGSCVSMTLSTSAGAATITLGGSFSGTLNFELSGDNGVTWTAAPTASTTSAGVTNFNVAGYSNIRVRGNPFASGTATITIFAGAGSKLGAGAGTVSSVSGTTSQIDVANGTTTPVVSIDPVSLSQGCQSSCTYVLTTADQAWVQPSAGSVIGTANQAQFVRFYNNATRGLGNACFRVTTLSAGGHGSIGVYSLTGTLLWSTGSFSTASATSLCVTPTPVTLAAGTNYYVAWCMDNTTAILAMAANSNLWQFTTNTGAPAHTFGTNATDTCTAGVLPSTITPANIANTTVQLPYVQVFL